MKILIVGGGGREHAIAMKLSESPRIEKLYAAPGNGGISTLAECFPVSATDIEAMTELAKKLQVDLVFVAPDDPLAMGMVDKLNEAGIKAFGPNKRAAVIEGSKVFAKELMKKYNIPTAEYQVCESSEKALDFIRKTDKFPLVIKADGLALGKGVIIARDPPEAEEAVRSIMEDKIFGSAGNQIIIEEFLTGPEVSVLAFTDSVSIKPMISATDHKRIYDGDLGPNTGGMGAVSPSPYYSEELADRCMKEIFEPTVRAMNAEGRPFKGCLYFGLMITEEGPKVIEYNCRFGDPETQSVLPLLETDLLDIIEAVIDERLEEQPVEWSTDSCAGIVMASEGYPGSYPKGIKIEGLDEKGQISGAVVYHAGTKLENGAFYTNGGRVLCISSKAKSLSDALDNSYNEIKKIDFKGAQYRKDILNKYKKGK